MQNMKTNFFDIESVAIIGASESEGKIGNTLLNNLSEFRWEKYGVNPKWWEYKNIFFYTSIAQLSKIPDIAVIVIPARFVLQALKECGEKGIKRVIIISAGFKEVGDIESEEEIQRMALKYNIRVLGPNCLGYIDAHKNLNLSFGGKGVKTWNIAMVSQSWAMAVALMDWAASLNIGFSKLISMGNKADIDENDLLESLANDEKSDVIVVYLESIENGRKFYEIARKLSKKKPIVMVKSGLSIRGKEAASSHTGALSWENEVLEVVFRDTGIHTTASLEDFFLWAEAFSTTVWKNIPESLAIITNAGGPWVMATDHCELNNISLQNFSKSQQATLKEGMPDASSMNNPIDIIGDATSATYAKALENMTHLDEDLATFLLVTPQTVTDVNVITQKIVEWKSTNPDKFLMTSFMGWWSVQKARDFLRDHDVLDYDYPRKGIIAYSELLKQKSWEKKALAPEASIHTLSQEKHSEITTLLSHEKDLCSLEVNAIILKAFEVNFLEDKLAIEFSQVETIWKGRTEEKLVAKIASKDIAHKTDCGWVVIGISSLEEAQQAYTNILKSVGEFHPNADISWVTFQEMLPPSKEVFIWMKRDISFWEVLIVWMWGIFVNIYEDVAMKLSPVNPVQIKKMFESLTGYPILNGARGDTPIDFDAIIDIVSKIQSIFHSFPEISEIDINPAFSNEKSSIIVDAKFYL